MDVFSAAKRSEVMSLIKGRGNRSTELALLTLLRRAKITGWRRHVTLNLGVSSDQKPETSKPPKKPKALKVTPDFLFREARLAMFVDGCFWHQCPLHSRVPRGNHAFWDGKLQRTVERDKQQNRALRAAGWRVLRLWEHELKEPDHVVRKIKRRLIQHGRDGNP